MRVAIVGGTGFIGGYLVDELLRAGHQPVVLVRPGSEAKVRQPDCCVQVTGDVSSADTLMTLLDGCDAVIYNVGILREFPRQGITFENTHYNGLVATLDAAQARGVSRLLLMSANGATQPGTPYQETKKRAEDHARESRMDVTIFRPSVVFGDPRGTNEIASQLYNDVIRLPLPAIAFYPGLLPGEKRIRMSPVHVEDLAAAFVSALPDRSTFGKSYELGGAETLTWREMLERVAAAVGRKKWILPMPVSLMWCAALLFDRLPFFPVTRDQLTMLAESNVAGANQLRKLIGRRPRSMVAAELQYLRGRVSNA